MTVSTKKNCEGSRPITTTASARPCSWEDTTALAFTHASKDDLSTASRLWNEAREQGEALNHEDPRKAAALNNAAIAAVLRADLPSAGKLLQRADQAWRTTIEAYSIADAPLTGRVSAFHISLAARYFSQFSKLHRDEILTLCRAGVAVTTLNGAAIASLDFRAIRKQIEPDLQAAFDCQSRKLFDRGFSSQTSTGLPPSRTWICATAISRSHHGPFRYAYAAAHLTALIEPAWLEDLQ